MKRYVNNSDCVKFDMDEVEECYLGPECPNVDVKHTEMRNEKEETF